MFTALASFVRAFVNGVRNPEYQALVVATAIVVVGGTVFYHYYENWSWIDSVYFVVVSLTTVGFGDFEPSTELSRMVTIGFLFFGVALLGTFISLVVKGVGIRHKARSRSSDASDSADAGE